jgi:hypothetical protein
MYTFKNNSFEESIEKIDSSNKIKTFKEQMSINKNENK